jgi:hypothetical protein
MIFGVLPNGISANEKGLYAVQEFYVLLPQSFAEAK